MWWRPHKTMTLSLIFNCPWKLWLPTGAIGKAIGCGTQYPRFESCPHLGGLMGVKSSLFSKKEVPISFASIHFPFTNFSFGADNNRESWTCLSPSCYAYNGLKRYLNWYNTNILFASVHYLHPTWTTFIHLSDKVLWCITLFCKR